MPTKIRLQRHGKKGYAFYHIVVADSRAPRDGKFIEKLGIYNPNTNPATIEIDFDRTLWWYENGAQPTDTTRAILSYKGVLYRHHLNKGVKKGALTQEEADKKFRAWLEKKQEKINRKKETLAKKAEEHKANRIKAEQEYAAGRLKKADETAPSAESAESAASSENAG